MYDADLKNLTEISLIKTKYRSGPIPHRAACITQCYVAGKLYVRCQNDLVCFDLRK